MVALRVGMNTPKDQSVCVGVTVLLMVHESVDVRMWAW